MVIQRSVLDRESGEHCSSHGSGCEPMCPANPADMPQKLLVLEAGEERINGEYETHGASPAGRWSYRQVRGSGKLQWISKLKAAT